MKKIGLSIGEQIRKSREELGFTQAILAEKSGFSSSQIISQIEKGERELKAFELVTLSRILKTDFYSLLVPPKTPVPQLLWRNKIDHETQKMKEREFLNHCQEYHDLEELCGFRARRNIPRFQIEPSILNFQTVRRIADECRDQLNLGSRPAACLEGLLENIYGVKIWYMDLGEKGSAACVKGPFGAAILMNKTEAPWRRNYNFAHEFFHLITWESLPSDFLMARDDIWQEAERVAEVFASQLLLPTDSVLNAFEEKVSEGRIKYADLVGIARDFDVSTSALLYRLLNLQRLDKETVERLLADQEFKKIDRSTMHQRWWDPPDIPERFVRLAFLAYQKGRCSRAKLASYLNVSLIDLSDFIEEYGLIEGENYQAEIAVT